MDASVAVTNTDHKEDPGNLGSFMYMARKSGQLDPWIAKLASDFLHPDWSDIDAILSQDADAPATMWNKVSSYPEFMAALAFRLSDADALRALPSELTVPWLTIPLPAWGKAAAYYQVMWKALLGGDDGAVQGAISLQERMRVLQERMPALTTTMDWINFHHFGLMPESIIETALAQSSSPMNLIDSLWLGDESLLQSVLLRTHPHAQIWPSSMIGKRALAALRKRAPEAIASLVGPARHNGDQGIFWPFHDDHKEAVVNIPVLMGFWVTTGVAMDWWHKSRRLLQVAEIHAFDTIWFQVAYNQGVKIALAYGLQSQYALGDA